MLTFQALLSLNYQEIIKTNKIDLESRFIIKSYQFVQNKFLLLGISSN